MTRAHVRRVDGLTLVELMVALAIGLGVALMAAQTLLAAQVAYGTLAEQAALDDGGRFALELVGRAVRQAAPFDPRADAAAAALSGLDARSLSHSAAALAGQTGAVNGSDVLAVRFAGSADGSALGCAGFAVAAGDQGWSIFYVAKSSQGDAELRCKYRAPSGNWSSDALVGGVDGFQVLYGLDTDTPADGTPNRYLNADAIARLDAAPPPEGGSWWRRVVSVRVGLLLHGARPVARGGAQRYHLLGPAYAALAGDADPGSSLDEAALPADLRRRERRLFATTVALPARPP
jgi:type IV pilus assembly protein PilW